MFQQEPVGSADRGSLSRAYGGIVREWSFLNYGRAIEPLYLLILLRSVVLALVTTAACLLVAWPVAYWLALRVSERFRSALLVLVIVIVAWIALSFGSR